MPCLKDWRTWRPNLSEDQKDFLRQQANRVAQEPDDTNATIAALFICIVTQDVWSKDELRKQVTSLDESPFVEHDNIVMLKRALRLKTQL